MKLKQVQLQGFKTFVERTVLNFTDDITCVVGPNGCGKSNLSDAIRWAMGEMSVKSLRGGQMEDVIFHGSDDMASTGMAEVTLVFDNADGLAPAEYSGFSEIQVTRRLFRSGESEYYINRTSCRLKDITDLFLGSGAGTKAYSIIEQGKIEEIITMKPEQRRVLIEEAAGVSKYRVRRLEASRKMEATRNNLVRIRDIIAELKRQMNSLNRQAKKAERYKQYRSELRDLEQELAAHKALELRREQKTAGEKIEGLSDEEIEIGARLEKSESELEQGRAALVEIEREFANWQARVVEASRAVEKAEQNLVMLRHQRESLERDKARLEGECRELEDREAAVNGEMESLDREADDLGRSILEARQELEAADKARADKETEYNELVEATAVLEKHLAGVQASVEKLAERIQWGEQRKLELEQRSEGAMRRIASLELSLEERARQNLNHNEKLYELKKDMAEFRQRVASAEQELTEAKTARAVAVDRLNNVRSRIARDGSRLESLREMEKNFEGYQTGVKAVMARKAELEAQGRNGTYGLIAEYITTEPEYELALEAVLGERIQSVLVKNRDHGLDNIRFLKNQGGRSSFLPLEGISPAPVAVPEPLRSMGAECLAEKVEIKEEYAPAIKAMIGDAMVVEDIESAARAVRDHNLSLTLVTRDGVMMDRIGVLAGGSPDSFSGLLSKKREMEEISARIEELKAEESRAGEEVELSNRKIKQAQEKADELREKAYRFEIDKNNLEKDLRQGTDAYNAMQEDIRSQQGELETVQEATENLVREDEQAREQLEQDRRAGERAAQDLEERRAVLHRLDSERAEISSRCTSCQVKAAGLSEKLEANRAHRQRLEKAVVEFKEGVEKRGHDIQAIERNLGAFSERMEEAEAQRAEAVRVAKGLEDRAGEQRSGYERETERLREMETSIKKLYRERENKKSERMDAELFLSQLKVQWEGLADNLRDRYSRELDDVIAELGPGLGDDYPLEGKREEREQLRYKLERMGEVNLTAIEEYEEVSERHSFLTNQEADLIQALDNLELTIGKINSAYRREFKKTFEEVSQRFQEVIPRLFSGGVGMLKLTDPDDLLESGVEILVQLPGKKMTTIALLSGGEKSLTATGLIIALFLVRPSPFCLLDEVDAALDDVNILRFNDIMKELSTRSQLILITHNKRTMELSQVLYGVTMEKKGISKIVSVRMRDPEDNHAAAANT